MASSKPYATAPTRAEVHAPVPPAIDLTAAQVCPSCGRETPLLVEGSDLCLPCDRLHFPALVWWPR